MTLPKRCCVKACERRERDSSSSLAAGEIKRAKSLSDDGEPASVRRATAFVADSELFSSAPSGSVLNSVTKLIPGNVANESRMSSVEGPASSEPVQNGGVMAPTKRCPPGARLFFCEWGWSSCFSMFAGQGSLKAELQLVVRQTKRPFLRCG